MKVASPACAALVMVGCTPERPLPPGWTDPPPGPDCTEKEWVAGVPANVLGARVVAGVADDEDSQAALDLVLADLEGGDGPWTHVVRGPWRGPVGEPLSWEGTDDLWPASVPEAVVTGEGERWLFFVDGDLDAMAAAAAGGEPLEAGWTGVAGIAAAAWDDGWVPVPLAFEGDPPLYFVDPDVSALPGGGWRMHAFGVPAEQACGDRIDPAAAPGPHWVYAADSEDLVHWTDLHQAWEAPEGATDPTSWCDEGGCGLIVSMGGTAPAAAWSADGETWEDRALSVPAGWFSMADVTAGPEELFMVVQGDDLEMRALSSDDGFTWREEEAPGIAGAGPTMVVEGGDAEVWVHRETR